MNTVVRVAETGEEKTIVYLTNGTCENTGHVGPEALDALGLDHETDVRGKFFPLTDSEAEMIDGDGVEIPGVGYALTGYSVLHEGRKWLAPTVEFSYRGDFFGPDAEMPTRERAEAKAKAAAKIAQKMLSGFGFATLDETAGRFEVLLMAPLEKTQWALGGNHGRDWWAFLRGGLALPGNKPVSPKAAG